MENTHGKIDNQTKDVFGALAMLLGKDGVSQTNLSSKDSNSHDNVNLHETGILKKENDF